MQITTKTPESHLRRLSVALLVLLFAAAVMIPNMDAYSLWLDEVLQLETAESFDMLRPSTYTIEMLRINHPPLHYILVKFWWNIAGYVDFMLRVFPVLMGILSVAVVYRVGVDLTRQTFGGLAMAGLYASMGFVQYYVHQVHNYGLFLLFTALVIFFYERWWQSPHDKRYMVGEILSSTLLIYTHYYGFFVILAVNIHAALWAFWGFSTYKKWLAMSCVVALTYVPWLPYLYKLQQAATDDPVSVPSNWAGISLELSILLFRQPAVYGAVIGLGLAALVWQKHHIPQRTLWGIMSLFIGLGTSLGLAILVNTWIASFADRRMIFWLIGVALFVGWMVTLLPRKPGWVVLGATMAVTLVAPLPPQLYGNWYIRDAVAFIADHAELHDFVFFQLSSAGAMSIIRPFPYYAHRLLDESIAFSTLDDHSLGNAHNRRHFANDIFAPQLWPRDRFWVLRTQPDNHPDPQPVTLDWVKKIEGRTFVHVEAQYLGLYIIDLFAAEAEHPPALSGAVEIPDKVALPQAFGGMFHLLDYRLSRVDVHTHSNGMLHVELDWVAVRQPDEDYAVGLYLIGEDGGVYAQWDGNPTHWGRSIPTTRWIVGVPIYSEVTLTMRDDAPPGAYDLVLALYCRTHPLRLPVDPFDQTELVLTRVNAFSDR